MSNDPLRKWIQTHSGLKAYPMTLTSDQIVITDIAHSLSNLCRFTGHCPNFYSVAEHCCHVSDVLTGSDRLAGLIHDAAEAYICDLSNPIKYLPEFEFYRRIEKEIDESISQVAGVSWPWPDSVKVADLAVYQAEILQLPMQHPDRIVNCDPADIQIQCWGPTRAKAEWLSRYVKNKHYQ